MSGPSQKQSFGPVLVTDIPISTHGGEQTQCMSLEFTPGLNRLRIELPKQRFGIEVASGTERDIIPHAIKALKDYSEKYGSRWPEVPAHFGEGGLTVHMQGGQIGLADYQLPDLTIIASQASSSSLDLANATFSQRIEVSTGRGVLTFSPSEAAGEMQFTSEEAARYAEAGRLSEWLDLYLTTAEHGQNWGLAIGLRRYNLSVTGPVDIDLSLLTPGSGPPGSGRPYIQDQASWDKSIAILKALLLSGTDFPPFIVDGTRDAPMLADGSHRHEAMTELSRTTHKAIIFS